MKIVLNDKLRLLSDEASLRSESRITASFAKFSNNVKAIELTTRDINGPRGGIDKECRVLVKLKRMQDIVVTVQDESLSKAIPSAINRAARSVGRAIERRGFRTTRDSKRLPKFGFDF